MLCLMRPRWKKRKVSKNKNSICNHLHFLGASICIPLFVSLTLLFATYTFLLISRAPPLMRHSGLQIGLCSKKEKEQTRKVGDKHGEGVYREKNYIRIGEEVYTKYMEKESNI